MKVHPSQKTNHQITKNNRPRLVSRGKALRIISIGKNKKIGDLYARLLGQSWWQMIALMILLYLLINLIFASAYFSIQGSIQNVQNSSFSESFFFSVQTFATIGYGTMSPHGLLANILVTIEAICGFAFYGVVTGIVFSKFSRPTARVLFSDRAVIGKQNDKNHFMLRLANERHNSIAEAEAKLTLLMDEVTAEGVLMRRFYDLPLVRNHVPILRLTWTVMHLINEQSPLFKMTQQDLEEKEAEIIISLSGVDETLSQAIYARHSYVAEEIIFNAQFEDILQRRKDSSLEIRYDKFHQFKVEK